MLVRDMHLRCPCGGPVDRFRSVVTFKLTEDFHLILEAICRNCNQPVNGRIHMPTAILTQCPGARPPQ